MKTMAFIGTGNMGGAILRAVCLQTEPSEIAIYNRTEKKAQLLAEECGCVVSPSAAEAAAGAKYVMIGVKPYDIAKVLRDLAPTLTDDQVIVSMAAGVSGDDITAALGKPLRCVRILPNTPCAIGKGVMLIAPCGDIEPEIIQELSGLFAGCGLVGYTDETHADAAMGIEGCTPAFAYMFIEALADGAVLTGIKRADAMQWAAQAVLGAAEMVLQTGKHPGQLKDEVCSPGGTTIEGVKALEEHGFRGAVMDAVVSAWEKKSKLIK